MLRIMLPFYYSKAKKGNNFCLLNVGIEILFDQRVRLPVQRNAYNIYIVLSLDHFRFYSNPRGCYKAEIKSAMYCTYKCRMFHKRS